MLASQWHLEMTFKFSFINTANVAYGNIQLKLESMNKMQSRKLPPSQEICDSQVIMTLCECWKYLENKNKLVFLTLHLAAFLCFLLYTFEYFLGLVLILILIIGIIIIVENHFFFRILPTKNIFIKIMFEFSFMF